MVKISTNHKPNAFSLLILKISLSFILILLISQFTYAGDITAEDGKAEIEKNNEVFLGLKNTEANGKDWRLVSAGTAGGIGVGKFAVYDSAAGKDRLTIDTAGNVGIGTASPVEKFHVTARSLFGTTMIGEAQSGFSMIEDRGATGLALLSTGALTNGMVILENGNVGIGTANPGSKMVVKSSSNSKGGALKIEDLGETIGYEFWIDGSNQLNLGYTTGLDSIMTINNGNVGIGSTNPGSNKLDVAGNIHATGDICTDAGGGKCLSSAGGGASAAGWTDDGPYVKLTTSTDKVGIGTPTPGSELDISGQLKISSSVNDKIVLAGAQAAPHTIYLDNSKGMRFWDSVSGELVRITNTGSVGIGSTNPGSNKLDVAGNIHATGDIHGGEVYTDGWFRSSGGGGLYSQLYDMHIWPLDGNSNYWGSRSNNGWRYQDRSGNNKGYTYFDSSGFGLLTAGGSWAYKIGASDNYNYLERLTYATDFRPTIIYDRDNTGYYIDPASSSRLNEIYTNTLKSNIYESPYAGSDSGLSGARHYQWGYQEPGAWSYPYPDLVLGYHTGIKMGAHPGYGGIRFYSDHPSVSSTEIMSIGNGDNHVRVANNLYAAAFFYNSDEKLKDNIMPSKGLDTINSLKGVSFTWKESGQRSAGLIAQDVERVLPEAVSTDKSTGIKSLNYGALTAPVVESIKELSQKNVRQDKKIEELENEIIILKQEIEKLKK